MICSNDSNMEWLASKYLGVTETGAKPESKTFVLKNKTEKRKNHVSVFVEWSVVKYQLCKLVKAQRFNGLYFEKIDLEAKILHRF